MTLAEGAYVLAGTTGMLKDAPNAECVLAGGRDELKAISRLVCSTRSTGSDRSCPAGCSME